MNTVPAPRIKSNGSTTVVMAFANNSATAAVRVMATISTLAKNASIVAEKFKVQKNINIKKIKEYV